MNQVLIDVGNRTVPKKDLIRVLLWGRSEFGIGEDDWREEQLSQARRQLPKEFADVSLHELSARFIRLRKDKLVPKVRKPQTLYEKVCKAARDFEKARNRRGFRHSEEYIEYMLSTEWMNRRDEHIKDCEYRCQLCGAETKLEGHHTPVGYSHLWNEDTVHLLALCKECHLIADMIRENGSSKG